MFEEGSVGRAAEPREVQRRRGSRPGAIRPGRARVGSRGRTAAIRRRPPAAAARERVRPAAASASPTCSTPRTRSGRPRRARSPDPAAGARARRCRRSRARAARKTAVDAGQVRRDERVRGDEQHRGAPLELAAEERLGPRHGVNLPDRRVEFDDDARARGIRGLSLDRSGPDRQRFLLLHLVARFRLVAGPGPRDRRVAPGGIVRMAEHEGAGLGTRSSWPLERRGTGAAARRRLGERRLEAPRVARGRLESRPAARSRLPRRRPARSVCSGPRAAPRGRGRAAAPAARSPSVASASSRRARSSSGRSRVRCAQASASAASSAARGAFAAGAAGLREPGEGGALGPRVPGTAREREPLLEPLRRLLEAIGGELGDAQAHRACRRSRGRRRSRA